MGRVKGGLSVAGERILKRLSQSVDPRAADMVRVIDTMMASTELLKKEAAERWPVSRDKSGRPQKSKRSGGKDHSIDRFMTRTRITQSAIVTSLVNDSPYGYFIRSHKTGRTQPEQQVMMKWRKGTTSKRYFAQISIGPKRHAYTFQVRTPGRRIGRRLAKQLQREITQLLRNEVT
jgi:hypothetical protein